MAAPLKPRTSGHENAQAAKVNAQMQKEA